MTPVSAATRALDADGILSPRSVVGPAESHFCSGSLCMRPSSGRRGWAGASSAARVGHIPLPAVTRAQPPLLLGVRLLLRLADPVVESNPGWALSLPKEGHLCLSHL